MKRSLPSLVIGGTLTIFLLSYMILYQVSWDEVAVVRTFGRIEAPGEDGVSPDVKTEPNWYFRLPWPVQDVDIYDTRLRMTEAVGEETSTADAKNVVVKAAITWKIAQIYNYVTSTQDEADAKEKLVSLVRDKLKATMGKYTFDQLVSNTEALKYDAINNEILALVKPQALTDYGIDVHQIGLETLTLPKEISEQVFEAMKKERQAESARYTSEGESTAASIRADADRIAETILAFADRRAKDIETEGMARAAEYNQTFAQDPELAVFLLEVDNLMKILKERATIILRTDTAPWYLLESIERPTPQAEPAKPKDVSASATTQPAVRKTILTPLPDVMETK